jgi:hydrogenase nickel incorporation protein HypB
VQAIQIVTGTVCHLDAQMIQNVLPQFDLEHLDVLFLENVGNLVCPSSYDLGEEARAILLSVTEGEDKPLKYPTIFNTADVVVITKIDIAEAVGFNRELALENIQKARPGVKTIEVSSKTGQGLRAWYEFVKGNSQSARVS